MPLDPNIILQGRGLQIDSPIDAASKAMTMGQLIRQGRRQEKEDADAEAIKSAVSKNVIQNPDGSTSLNRKAVLSDLYKLNPSKAMEVESTFKTQDREQEKAKFETLAKQTEIAKQLAWSINDPTSYEAARQKSIELGLPNADKMPSQYPGDGMIKQMQMATLTAFEQMAQHWKQKDYDQKEREIAAKKAKEADENLPIDKKKLIEGLSAKNANKISIANQINAVMENWDSYSDDQKLSQGRQLLKTLNSPEGADAIGAEEAKRLGSKLEFAAGNFTNSNPTQFGRDLGGFAQQARDTAKNIESAVSANKKEIDSIYGRKSESDKFKGLFVEVRAPDGSIRKIPQDQLQAALAAGGQAVDSAVAKGR